MIEKAALLSSARRAPRFVSRRTAAALLDLSGSGFNNWVKRGLLPPPAAGTPNDEPRWEWEEIARYMRGDRSSAPRDLLGMPAPVQHGHKRGPAPGHGGRPRNSAEQDHG